MKKPVDNSKCQDAPGRVAPVIDREKCEGKAECVEVCPYDVFEIGRLTKTQRQALSGRGKVKAFFHGNRQAFVVKPDACHACGICLKACPESAIQLRPLDKILANA